MSARGSQAGSERAGSRQQSQGRASACSSPRSQTSSRRSQHSSPRRHNKIYHTPPTPPPEVQLEKEKSFVLDSMAVSSISTDYSKTNPKLGPVIPPYNACRDRHVKPYFGFLGVDRTMKKTMTERSIFEDRQAEQWPHTSIDGHVLDSFNNSGAGYQYVSRRNQFGAGHSRESIDGHAQFMAGVQPVTGWHGKYGYRRTTPWLRKEPSPFGTASASPTH